MKMNRKLSAFLTTVMLTVGGFLLFNHGDICMAKTTITSVKLDKEHFPDDDFRKFVRQKYDTNRNGILSRNEIVRATEFSIYNDSMDECRLSDLTGIEHLTELKTLSIIDFPIDKADLNQNKKLTSVTIGVTSKNSLQIKECTKIKKLDLYLYYATSKCPELKTLTNLESLEIRGRESFTLSSIHIKNPNKLKKLSSFINADSVDMTKYRNMEELRVYGTFQTVNVKGLTKLKELYCSSNRLKSVSMKENKELESVDVSRTKVKTLNLKECKKLKKLLCSSTKITSLNVESNTKLEYLDCNHTAIQTLDLRKNKRLKEVSSFYSKVSKLLLPETTTLTAVVCNSSKVEKLDVTKNPNLRYLDCSGTKVTAINVSKNSKLERLLCHHLSGLKRIDVTKNQGLKLLDVRKTAITKLNVSKNTKLTSLECGNTNVAVLNLSANTELKYLYCNHMQLTSLNLSKNDKLEYLICNGNLLKELDLTNNRNLNPNWLKYDEDVVIKAI